MKFIILITALLECIFLVNCDKTSTKGMKDPINKQAQDEINENI